jgi:hypothetical protein
MDSQKIFKPWAETPETSLQTTKDMAGSSSSTGCGAKVSCMGKTTWIEAANMEVQP